MTRGLGCAWLAVVLLLAPQALAQDGAKPSTAPFLKVDSSFVWVPISLEPEDGRALQNAGVTKVRLWDNGIPQTVSAVRTDDLPISLVILMQTGASAGRYLDSYRDLPSVLPSLIGNAAHEITLITFDSHVREIWHFPKQSDGVNYALTHQKPGDLGAAIKDALAFGVRQLQAEPGRFRRVVLLLSADKDNGSSTSSQSLLEQLGSASTVVYSLHFSTRTQSAGRSRFRGRSNPDPITREFNMALRGLDASTAQEAASLTGGCAFQFRDQRSFNSGLLAIAESLRDGYTVGFQPVPQVPGFHILKLKAAAPEISVTARKAYWSATER
jgi:VWFA-related protein